MLEWVIALIVLPVVLYVLLRIVAVAWHDGRLDSYKKFYTKNFQFRKSREEEDRNEKEERES